MGKLLDQAILFATEAHRGQLRKGSETPYILHPLEAAAIVGTMTADDEIIAAAVLHDVVEDTNTTMEEIEALFGKRIAGFVAAESEDKHKELPAEASWKLRKQETLDHLETAPIEVKMITLGDKLSNIRSVYRDQIAIGDALWQHFHQKDKQQHGWYYSGIADRLAALEGHVAYTEYCSLVKKVFS